MKLLSFDFMFKYDLVRSVFSGTNSFQGTTNHNILRILHKLTGSKAKLGGAEIFWTSATDSKCSSTFGWCSVNRRLKNATWRTGQPLRGITPSCVAVSLQGGKIELYAEQCTKEFNFICEV
jgi:hypothetical protein